MAQLCSASRSANILAAEAWVEVRAPLDRQLSPLGLRAMDAVSPRPGEAIVDVGCGTGQTVLQLAARVGQHGRVIGVDIAPLVLEVAREQASGIDQISFIEGDAAALHLPDESVDAVFSRFGVMAFPDPVAAFRNFHRMLKPNGRLAFVCWRSLEQNELDLLPLRAASLEHLLDPTPYSFEDPDFIRRVLTSAGFKDVVVEADDRAVTSGDLEAMAAVLLKVGPLGRILRETPELRSAAEPRVRAALARKGDATQVALQAATWVVSARALDRGCALPSATAPH